MERQPGQTASQSNFCRQRPPESSGKAPPPPHPLYFARVQGLPTVRFFGHRMPSCPSDAPPPSSSLLPHLPNGVRRSAGGERRGREWRSGFSSFKVPPRGPHTPPALFSLGLARTRQNKKTEFRRQRVEMAPYSQFFRNYFQELNQRFGPTDCGGRFWGLIQTVHSRSFIRLGTNSGLYSLPSPPPPSAPSYSDGWRR